LIAPDFYMCTPVIMTLFQEAGSW